MLLSLRYLGAVAQLGEHLPCTPEDSPAIFTKPTQSHQLESPNQRNILWIFCQYSERYIQSYVHTGSQIENLLGPLLVLASYFLFHCNTSRWLPWGWRALM